MVVHQSLFRRVIINLNPFGAQIAVNPPAKAGGFYLMELHFYYYCNAQGARTSPHALRIFTGAPLALWLGGMRLSMSADVGLLRYSGIAVVIDGIISSTLLTLLVLPVLYALVHRKKS